MQNGFRAEYVVLWADWVVEGFDTYEQTKEHIQKLMEEEKYKKIGYKVFSFNDNEIYEVAVED